MAIRVHVVGAGLGGLACATALAARGVQVVLYEAGGQAGGRCRSYHDATLERTIDNGNHLILGANPETFRYLDRIGARQRLQTVAPAALPFLDLGDGTCWTLRPGRGPLPLWLNDPERRVAGVGALPHLAALKLAWAGSATPVAEALDLDTPIGRRLWRPLAVSILNTAPEEASARLLWAVLRRTLLRGEAACRPSLARDGLSDALVTPALAFLHARGAAVRLHAPLRRLGTDRGRVTALCFDGGTVITVDRSEAVVLAVPPERAADLVPGLAVPTEHRPILNAHFRLSASAALAGGSPVLGLVGGTAEWLFLRGDIASVTVSAAERLIDLPASRLAELVWHDVARVLQRDPATVPPTRIIKEKRATFAATPAMERLRPPVRTAFPNLVLAGDWTRTGLPATIEGAVLSGHRAAYLARLA